MELSIEEKNKCFEFAKEIYSNIIKEALIEEVNLANLDIVFGTMLVSFWRSTKCDKKTMQENCDLIIKTVLDGQCGCEEEENEG